MSKGTLNRVSLIGNIGKDPDIKTLDSGIKIATMSLATSESRKDKEPETSWHRIVAFGKLAEIIEQYIKKGSKVHIDGRISYRQYTGKNNMEQKTITEILANQMVMLGGQQKDEPALLPTDVVDAADFLNDTIPF